LWKQENNKLMPRTGVFRTDNPQQEMQVNAWQEFENWAKTFGLGGIATVRLRPPQK
jgi:hypothetical protein